MPRKRAFGFRRQVSRVFPSNRSTDLGIRRITANATWASFDDELRTGDLSVVFVSSSPDPSVVRRALADPLNTPQPLRARSNDVKPHRSTRVGGSRYPRSLEFRHAPLADRCQSGRYSEYGFISD